MYRPAKDVRIAVQERDEGIIRLSIDAEGA
jgi:hypothetical protein